jgi:hypothetical protein
VAQKKWEKTQMKKLITICAVVAMISAISGVAQAAPTWYTISFTGEDMFNYTTSVAPRADQDAPRRLRDWTNDELNYKYESYEDADSDGTNDFAEWADENLETYGFSYFNLWGETIAPTSWDQPYHAVADQGDGKYGVESWKNQTVNGVAVHAGMGSVGVWDGGIVLANQSYNTTNYAFPVWRAPTGTQLTMANAASLLFSVDVLIDNYDTAFEPDGKLRVYFGGYNVPQGTAGAGQEVGGIMLVPEPATMALLGLGGLLFVRKRK